MKEKIIKFKFKLKKNKEENGNQQTYIQRCSFIKSKTQKK